MIDCPHCFERVIPTDHVRPICQQDERKQPNHGLVKIVVTPTSRFGDSCCLCNFAADRKKKLVAWSSAEYYQENKFSFVRFIVALFSMVILPFAVFLPREGGMARGYHKVSYKIPICSACRHRDVQVIETLPDRGVMMVAVAKEFADDFNLHNQSTTA